MSSPLRLYNTLTRSKEVFSPIDPANVRLYVCGPTVYDLAHIGNARPLIVFDVLYRLLRHRYGADCVTYVRNITDVDDKINLRAAEREISIRELTDETNRIFQEDVRALGCLDPTHQPRATDYVAKPEASHDMIRMIARLVERGFAYESQGHVLFDVPKMRDYGALSHRPLDDMIAGARVDVAPYKRGDMDFVLWKPSKNSEPGWGSPWGFGRPGWHIECSAMAGALLGETFDIHGGGIDLVFPHHENEIAQSRCCFDTPVMANVWMHNGFLQVEGEKMSKSLGNFVTIHDLLHTDKFGGRKWPREVLRLAMLKTHYRQPIDWTVRALQEAMTKLDYFRRAANLSFQEAFEQHLETKRGPSKELIDALNDDLNAHSAIAVLERHFSQTGSGRLEAHVQLANDMEFMGLTSLSESREFLFGLEVEIGDEAKFLIDARNIARARKDWKESDRIRDQLAAMGIALKDNKDGTTTWEVKR
jgi:cysteinyl-tRNA synthetase